MIITLVSTRGQLETLQPKNGDLLRVSEKVREVEVRRFAELAREYQGLDGLIATFYL